MFKSRRLKKKLMVIDNDVRDLLNELEKENISEHDRILTLEQIALCMELRYHILDNKKYV